MHLEILEQVTKLTVKLPLFKSSTTLDKLVLIMSF